MPDSGFSPIIATASEHNIDLLTSIGATHIINRHTSGADLASEIARIVQGTPLQVVYDAVSSADTQQVGWDVLATDGTIVVVLPPTIDKKDEAGEKHVVHVVNNVQLPQNREIGTKLYGKLTQWLEEGSIIVSLFHAFSHVHSVANTDIILTSQTELKYFLVGYRASLAGLRG